MVRFETLLWVALLGMTACDADESSTPVVDMTPVVDDTGPIVDDAEPMDAGPAPDAALPPAFFTLDGTRLDRPEGYREWVFIGEPVTPNELNDGRAPFPEIHSVYIDPASYQVYRDDGVFPDGTIIMKELVSVGARRASSGNGFFMGDFIGLEATIKSAEHFPDEPGNWAYFSFTNEAGGGLSSTAEPFPTASCNGCHEANADQDFVFTQYYPVLREVADDLDADTDARFVIEDGALRRPVGYRRWVYAGGPLTPDALNNGSAAFPEFHSVYIDPESYAALRQTGEFPDGTILIKELAEVGATTANSGNGYFMGDNIGLEATIKSAEHFPDEPGNWAYFSFTDEETRGGPLKAEAEPFPTAACNACHAMNADQDFVFTQFYPVLRAAVAESEGETLRTTNIWQPTRTRPDSLGDIPLDRAALHAWLADGAYRDFPAQNAEPVPGTGPHVMPGWPVRIFVNETLSTSLDQGNAQHPAGAFAVKEMYDGDDALLGWAVAGKLGDDSADGENWFWYEAVSTTDPGAVVAAGASVPGCVGCHAIGGSDFVLADWPLE